MPAKKDGKGEARETAGTRGALADPDMSKTTVVTLATGPLPQPSSQSPRSWEVRKVEIQCLIPCKIVASPQY